MSDDTPRLRLGQLVDGQELDAMAINDALVQLDMLTDACFKGQFANTPPSSPADGDTYLLGAAPTGAWSGYAYKIAYCIDGGWRFRTPFDGMRAVVLPGGTFIYYSGGSWSNFTPPPSFVAFPATQIPSGDPNTLDDYEEGSWIPIDASGAGLGLTVNFARYTKIGCQVTAAARLSYPANSSSAAAAIGGFPFATDGNIYTGSVVTGGSGVIGTYISGAAASFFANARAAVANSVLAGNLVFITYTYFTS